MNCLFCPLRQVSLYNINLNQTIEGHESKGIDCQPKKLLIVIQILLDSIMENVRRTVWRICILMFEYKG